MINRILPIACIGVALLANTGCKNNGGGSKKSVNGIEYTIVKDAPGNNAKFGDIIEFHLVAKCDTLELGNTWKGNAGKPVSMPLDSTMNKTDFQAVFPFMSPGDSAVVEISCDTMIKYMPPSQQQLPPWLQKGKKVIVNVSLISAKSKADFENEQKQKSAKQIEADDKILQDYFAKNSIKATKTASGLYYNITKEGTGAQVQKGQMVSMNYTGKTLEGKTFDSNVDSNFHHVQAFTFPVGLGQVIPGWDEGVQLLKNGSKAVFYIPSALAYGERGAGPDVGPNTILMFDVEVTGIKSADSK